MLPAQEHAAHADERLDAGTGEPVSRGDTVKGYEFEKNRYVTVTDEDLDSVKVESSGMMTIEKFVTAGSIDPIYYDASYYLAPDGKAGEEVYAVLREAIEKTGRVALSRVVIGQRERTIALRPTDAGLVAHTLNEQRDLNEAEPLFVHVAGAQPDPEMVGLAVKLIDRQTGDYDPSDLEDRYETRLRAMLDAKVQGEGLSEPAAFVASDTNVIDLMAALRKSLLGEAIRKPEAAGVKPAAGRSAAAAEDSKRRQSALKLPIKGGKAAAKIDAEPVVVAPTRARRKAS